MEERLYSQHFLYIASPDKGIEFLRFELNEGALMSNAIRSPFHYLKWWEIVKVKENIGWNTFQISTNLIESFCYIYDTYFLNPFRYYV